MPLALLLIQGAIQALPLIGQVVMTIRRNGDGTVTWQTEITQAQAKFDADIKQVQDWQANHPTA